MEMMKNGILFVLQILVQCVIPIGYMCIYKSHGSSWIRVSFAILLLIKNPLYLSKFTQNPNTRKVLYLDLL
jgi:hypothetical protein